MKCPYCEGSGQVEITVGALITERRKRAGLTQDQLAKAIGLSRPAVANMESDRQGILVETLVKIARAIECSPSDLMPS